ncbi:Gar1/Naf1 RNA binding region-domain-containing protein [Ephemerocybe angulata]|uniref:H/ACA ribonucleoprotein complex non-core subunit NAF1 n=1 Tax=Ephemerocybe angulata TaxID=980116 RepID=A0A8H6MHL2_9AGAR|nr:Gar1/Naf1 RNA binding region-domain-containing protein [Tulosesus angulatus]
MSGFKIPDSIPQDLLLIQEMVGVPEPPKPEPVQEMEEELGDDDISSSDGGDSEDEIEAKLVLDTQEDSDPASDKPASEPYHSDSDSSSDSEPEEEIKKEDSAIFEATAGDDEDEDAPAVGAATYLQTKHEVVGDIMSIVNQVAIVRGLPSDDMSRGSQKALDSDTLLVFDDRNVMGYIYETFGPTNQPLYQVKYNSKYPLDPERVKVSREVFMVPSKTKFVFVDQIKAYKGSDASNVYDEEPADDELEFSDDEAEAAYKSRMKRKRGESRARSVANSREPTPNPSHMRDYELSDNVVLGHNAYDEHGPYDQDFSAPGPSRPAPIPYDDPYSLPSEISVGEDGGTSSIPSRPTRPPPTRQEARPRGRGRGGNFNQNSRGRGGRGGGKEVWENHLNAPRHSEPAAASNTYDPRAGTQMQEMGQSYYQDYSHMGHQGGMMQAPFGGQASGHGQGMPFVQPHINPLFANSFGFPMGQQGMGYGGQFGMGNPYGAAQGAGAGYQDQQQQSQQQWTNQWAPPTTNQHPSGGQGQG